MNITAESAMPGKLYVILTAETQAETLQIKQIREAGLAAGVGDLKWIDYDGPRGVGVAFQLIPDPFNLLTENQIK